MHMRFSYWFAVAIVERRSRTPPRAVFFSFLSRMDHTCSLPRTGTKRSHLSLWTKPCHLVAFDQGGDCITFCVANRWFRFAADRGGCISNVFFHSVGGIHVPPCPWMVRAGGSRWFLRVGCLLPLSLVPVGEFSRSEWDPLSFSLVSFSLVWLFSLFPSSCLLLHPRVFPPVFPLQGHPFPPTWVGVEFPCHPFCGPFGWGVERKGETTPQSFCPGW